MSETEDRPVWEFNEISEAEFRVIYTMGAVVTVKAKWAFTSSDTSVEWLVAEDREGKETTLPSSWRRVLEFVGNASGSGLFKYTFLGERCLKSLAKIDAWEEQNKRDRREFEQLKKKFASEAGRNAMKEQA